MKVSQKGQITLPAELRKKEDWNPGTLLTIEKDQKHSNFKISKKVNLYDTDFGNYDFQSELVNNPELSEVKSVGNEGWGFE